MTFDPAVSVITTGGAFGMPTADSTMSAVIERIRNPEPELLSLLNAARAVKDDKTKYRKAKENLPSYTVSGTFPTTGYEWTAVIGADGKPVLTRKGKPKRQRTPAADKKGDGKGQRNEDGLRAHNGVFAFDYDGIADGIDGAIERLQAHPSVVYTARSVSGDGFHAGVRVELPTDVDFTLNSKHKILWREVAGIIRRACDLPKEKSDSTSQNANRIHFYSADDKAWFNGDAKPLTVRAWDEIAADAQPRRQRSSSRKVKNDDELNERLGWLRKDAGFLPVFDGADDANRFEGIYFGLVQLGENDLAEAYRARHSGSRAADPDRADRAPHRSASDKSKAVNVLLKAMRDNGWTDPRIERRKAEQAEKDRQVGQAGYTSRTDVNAVEWILTANADDVIAAFEHNPPPEADGVSAGTFYRRLPNGLLSKRTRELGELASNAFRAYVEGARRLFDEDEMKAVITHACSSLQKIGAVRKLAEGISEVEGALSSRDAVSPAPIIDLARVDADKAWLGTLNGAVNLRNGEFITNAHEREIYISRFVPVAYRKDATSKRFDQLLNHPTSPKAVDFTLDCAARALHRKPRQDRRFVLMYDEGDEAGRSGKSAVWDALSGTLGDYAEPLQKDALEKSTGGGRANPEMRPLAQAALVYLKELASANIGADELKGVAGETEVTFRMLFGNPVTREVIGTIFGSANGKPNVALWDSAVVDRYTPIEFVRIPEDQIDHELARVWRGETDESQEAQEALFADLIRRAIKFADGPPPLPDWVQAAKEMHRTSSVGNWGQFREARLAFTGDENDLLTTSDVWSDWATWNEVEEGKDRIDGLDRGKVTRWITRDFPKASKSTKRVNGKQVRAWRGIVLKADDAPPPTAPKQEPLVKEETTCSGCGRKGKLNSFGLCVTNCGTLGFQNVAWWAQNWNVSPTTARERCEARVAAGTMVQAGSGIAVSYAERR